ncbi:MAG: FkbM family methyltransferase [Planctomycetaceae bacterium]|nr:FkbM family methyltransferase [Planctomycetaceae bacterium]
MGLVKKLSDRLAGNRLSRGRTLAPIARRKIEEGLRASSFDAPTAEYLRAHLPYLATKKRHADWALFFGKKRARKILGLKPEDVEYNTAIFYDKIKAWLKDGVFDFNGIRLMQPLTAGEEKLLALEFIDLVLPVLLGPGHYDLIRGLGMEGPYEMGNVTLKQGDVVVDAGANMGMFTAVAARAGCRVLAFEPIKFIRETYLEKNVALNGGEVEILPYALSDRPEELQFVSFQENLGASRRVEDLHKDMKNEDPVEIVQALPLDDIVRDRGIERIDFIKADIEGSERRLLLGAREVLRNFAPKLSLCTYHLSDDPEVMTKIILDIQPKYRIVQRESKLYASVE